MARASAATGIQTVAKKVNWRNPAHIILILLVIIVLGMVLKRVISFLVIAGLIYLVYLLATRGKKKV